MATAYCFDLDGTLTQQELLPLIASSVGLEDEISVLTEATINAVSYTHLTLPTSDLV